LKERSTSHLPIGVLVVSAAGVLVGAGILIVRRTRNR
jgi:hypothetical protein